MSRKDLQDAAARGLFADEISSAPDYLGHRERLRERFHASGGESLQDYELLELFLFGVIPRRDTKPIAKALLARFGSFGEVISAPVEALCEVDGIGETTATSLKAVQAAAQRLLQTRVKDEPLISSWSELIAYCTAQMAYNPIEQFCLTYVATLHFDCGFALDLWESVAAHADLLCSC